MTCSRPTLLQIHPTRFCNLACLHCYSSSGPTVRDGLGIDLIRGVLADAASEGYEIAGFSGGEPTLYPQLPEALHAARGHGFVVTVTTNGTRLTEELLLRIRDNVDLVAVSIDGTPSSHNRIRNSSTAFRRMDSRVPLLKASGIPFGFIFTLTQHNMHELPWVAEYAVEHGAGLLQIHPLENAGRATEALPGETPDSTELAFGYVLAERLRRIAGEQLRIKLDVSVRDALDSISDLPTGREEGLMLSQCANPLVVESDGTVVPLQHGMSRAHALGTLDEAPLRRLGPRWMRERYPAYRDIQTRTARKIQAEPSEYPFLNWFELLGQAAARDAARTQVQLPGYGRLV